METFLKIALWIIVFMFLFEYIENVPLVLGYIFGAIQSIFWLFQYIGADCQFISKFNVIFLWIGITWLAWWVWKKEYIFSMFRNN